MGGPRECDQTCDCNFYSPRPRLTTSKPQYRNLEVGILNHSASPSLEPPGLQRLGEWLGHFKNAVVMNIRVNNISDLDVMEGSCRLNFFLDLAFWVPIFDEDHYAEEETIGSFALYEPVVDFPYVRLFFFFLKSK